MAISFTDWNSRELYHFGVKGMRHGVRKYQNQDGSLTEAGRAHYGVEGKRSAMGVSRDLRRLEKERAGAQTRADYFKNKTVKAAARAAKKALKTGTAAKLSARQQRLTARAQAYQKLANSSKEMTNKIIKSALSKGYSVHSRDTMRFVRKGMDKPLMLVGRRGTSVGSIKYHVHNNGLGVRKHRKSVGLINRSRHRSNFF